jgi:hypothetical protein
MCQSVDWFRVIVDLRRNGYTHAAIGAALQVARTTVLQWQGGSRPRFEDGERLLTLFETVTGKSRNSVFPAGYTSTIRLKA